MHCCSYSVSHAHLAKFHIARFTMYEGVAAFDDIRTAAHVVPDRYLAAAPDDFFKHQSEN